MEDSQMSSHDYGEGYFEDGIGSNYHSYGHDNGWPVVLQAIQIARPVTDLLEVACAKGFFVQTARSAGWDAVGVDISEYAVGCAPEETRPYVQVANAVSLPFDTEQFDVVCSFEFLEHVPDTEMDNVLDEMERVARPGALMLHKIGLDLTGEEDRYARFGDAHNHDNDTTHVNMQSRDWWQRTFESRGWDPAPDTVDLLNKAFYDRDWWDRWFAYRW